MVLATKWGFLDRPDGERKQHARPVPLLGGVAIFLAVGISVVLILMNSDALTGGEVTARHYVGFLLGGLVLMIGGALDDRYKFPPGLSMISPVLAILIAIGSGIQVDKITNPLGGAIELSHAASNIIVFVWLMGSIYAMKLLDGVDGLTTSVGSVGAFMVMLLALTTAYFQPDVALLSAIALGALLGFLIWNAPPARIFLGEGGSTFVGYLIGILAVISGGKLALAALVLGVPMLDVAIVAVGRMRKHGLAGMVKGDRTHLHHRLSERGWNARNIVLAYTSVALAFGGSALFLQSKQKVIAIILLAVFVCLVAAYLVRRESKKYA